MIMNDETKPLKQPVFLCGMMGSGKSTVGRVLAERLNVTFHDLDSLIEEKAEKSIPEIFEESGEETFRKVERETLLEIAKSPSGVIALGGGSLQNQHLTDHIKLSGWLVFLKAPIDEIADRLHRGNDRPMISDKRANKSALHDKISSLMKQRIPYYSQAHLTVQIKDLTPRGIAEAIIDKLAFYEQRDKRLRG